MIGDTVVVKQQKNREQNWTGQLRFVTATPSSVREVNRSIVLNLIRVCSPISRVELSRRTGIVRSNVSEIVDELLQAGFVVEKRAVAVGRGRVPLHLSLNETGFHVLGVSVRRGRTTLALAGLSGSPKGSVSFDTPARPAALTAQIQSHLAGLRKGLKRGDRVAVIGLSLPGLVDSRTGRVHWIPELPEYSNFELGAELEKATGVNVSIDNDCNVAALAELWLAEESDVHLGDFVLVEVGDWGVGGGIILNRELYRGNDGTFVGEFGHMSIDLRGPECACGRKGCWERYVCNDASWRRFDPQTPFAASKFDEILAAAEQGDKAAIRSLRETARFLALGISNLVYLLNPRTIVIAGRLTRVWELLEDSLREVIRSSRIPATIRPASLPVDELFMKGAITLALGQAFANPSFGLHFRDEPEPPSKG